MLSGEFQNFYKTWLNKADSYHTDDLSDIYDRFFTLYVLYNRIYAEVTFTLVRAGEINLANRKRFPDLNAATTYIVKYIGADKLVTEIERDDTTKEALTKVCTLVEDGVFHFILDMVTLEPRREDDLNLMRSLKSPDVGKKAMAIVEMIYAIRCNTFHGNKQFTTVQQKILIPVSTILRKLIQLAYSKLADDATTVLERD
ncbi:MAG: hypothetical protein C0417_03865 [Chlorobiaceae bacterium]|nr:hypothetical protein [Chlorobiaceae bacterium]